MRKARRPFRHHLSFMSQRFDRIQHGGTTRRIDAEDNADHDRNAKSDANREQDRNRQH